MSQIYHLLDEREAFSERNGGAISRWAANVLHTGPEIVVCPSSDGSWAFPPARTFQLPRWNRVGSVHPFIYRAPWCVQRAVYLPLFAPLLARLRPGDIVYVHNRPACAAVLASVAPRHGFRVFLHMHNSMLHTVNAGQRRALRNIPIVFCSAFLRREVEAALPGHFQRTHVVYNGADERRFYPEPRAEHAIPSIVFTGRLVPYKGAHVLIAAMTMLQRQGIQAVCRIIGGSWFGNRRPTSYIRNLRRNSPDNCDFLGYHSGEALSQLVRASDVFCCPSIWNDPFPLAPIEGMAAGLPVVASSVGGLPEVLAHGGGILVPPNDPERLAAALASLLTDESRRRQMGSTARSAVEQHFLWSHVRRQYLDAVAAA